MKSVGRIMNAFVLPFLLLNTFGGIVSGVWLIILGRWAEVGLGILLLMCGAFGLGFVILTGIVFAGPAMHFQRTGNRSGVLVFGFLSVAWTMLVITVWCSAILFIFTRRADSTASLIALLLWSYGVAIGPLAFLAQKDAGNEYSMLSTFFAQVAYLLVISLDITVGLSLFVAFVLIGAVMLCAAILGFRIATERERAQEFPGV